MFQNFQSESPEELLKALFFGGLEQVDASLADKNPIDLFISEIKAEAVKNPFLLTREEDGAVNQLGEEIVHILF